LVMSCRLKSRIIPREAISAKKIKWYNVHRVWRRKQKKLFNKSCELFKVLSQTSLSRRHKGFPCLKGWQLPINRSRYFQKVSPLSPLTNYRLF
jgi:hypothetical protein